MAVALQKRVEAALTTLQRTGSKAAAAGAFLYPSTMTWSGRGGFVSLAPRNQPWRNVDPLDNSAVMSCLAWVIRNFGQAMMRTVREKRDGSLTPVDVTGFLDLLYRPNESYSAYTLWAATLLSYHVDGNAYWIKVRNARGFGLPTALWYEPHWNIKPHCPDDGSEFIDYYERRINGTIQKIPPQNVVHFRNGLNPANQRYGLAPLRAALLEVFTDNEAAAYTASLLKNMAIPGVVINPRTPIGLTLEKAEAIKQKWVSKFGGDNRGEPLLLDFEADVTTLGFSPSDMDFAQVRRIGEERISGVLGIPAIVAGLGAGLESSTYNNLSNLKKSAFEENLVPTWRCLAEELTRQLLRDFTPDPNIWLDFDTRTVAALKEDQNQREQRARENLSRGGILVDEFRDAAGLPPLPNGAGQVLLLPTNVRPATPENVLARAAQEITDPVPSSIAGVVDDSEDGESKKKDSPSFLSRWNGTD
jgi:HK97 family phage portal protein